MLGTVCKYIWRPQSKTRLRLRDSLRTNLKRCSIDPNNLEKITSEREREQLGEMYVILY